MSEVTVRVSSGLGLSLGGKIVEVTPYRMVLGLALIGLRLGSLGNRIHSRVRVIGLSFRDRFRVRSSLLRLIWHEGNFRFYLG